MLNIGIYIYPQAEVLDFSGPFEVFSTASRIAGSQQLFRVFLIAQSKHPVSARGGFRVCPQHTIRNHPELDLLIIAGGVHTDEMQKPAVISWIAQQAKTSCLIASVCTGAFLLAKAGVIEQQKVTTHWQDIDDLQQQFAKLQVEKNVRWVEQGDVITSAGISAGIDMSLYLVSKLHNQTLAEKTARQMEYSWLTNTETH